MAAGATADLPPRLAYPQRLAVLGGPGRDAAFLRDGAASGLARRTDLTLGRPGQAVGLRHRAGRAGPDLAPLAAHGALGLSDRLADFLQDRVQHAPGHLGN